MCGRFSLTQRLDVLERIFKAKAKLRDRARATYNVAPTQPVLAICEDDPQTIVDIDWGFTIYPRSGEPSRLLVNAKAETLHARPMFAEAFAKRRALILADGFFEWETRAGKRYPKYFRRKDGSPFAFAGLFEEEGAQRHGVIITCEPNELVAPVHNRMPVILADPHAWLQSSDAATLQSQLAPFDATAMQAYNVNPAVNLVDNDSPRCIEPYEPPEMTLF